MPLNIDWQQILLHLFNFIILAAGLSFLLFKPVKKFMAQREESYKKAAAEHARKLEETETLEKERQVKIAALDSDLTEREKQALSVTEARKKRMLEEAREEADKIVEDGRRRDDVLLCVKEDGSYWIDGREVTLEALEVELERQPERLLNIYMDERAPFAKFVAVMDVAKAKRAGRFVISTDRNEASAARSEP